MIDAPRNTTAPEPKSSSSSDVSIFDVLGVFRRRKWLFLFGLASGLGLAALYYFQATPDYESKVEVLVMPKNQNLPTANANGTANMSIQQEIVDEGTMATHIQLLQSPEVIEKAIVAENLMKLRTFREALASAKESGRRFDPVTFITNDHLTVTAGGDGKAKEARVLRATFRGPYPDDNVAVLQALVASYKEFLGSTFTNTSSEAIALIERAKGTIGDKLKELEEEYKTSRKKAPLFWKGKESVNLHQERLSKIEESLTEITQRYAETKARLEVIEETLATKGGIDQLNNVEKLALLSESDVQRLTLLVDASRPDPNSKSFQASNPVRQEQAQAEYERLLSLLLDEAKLVEDYGPDHPKVKSVREQVKLTRDFLQKNSPEQDLAEPVGLNPGDLLEAHLGLLRHDLAEMEKRRTDLETTAAKERTAAKELVAFELDDETKSGAIERQKELYEAVVERLREISLIQNYGGYITEVIAQPKIPDRQASPRLSLVMGLGGLAGVLLGCGLALLVDLADRTFRDPDEICQALDLQILAHVPRMRISKAMRKSATNSEGEKLPAPEVIAYHDPNGPASEAIRGLRTSLYFGANGLRYKVLQVTSPNPSDGKTTVAANLAVTAAKSGRRVIVIDADMRRPRLEKLFNARSDVGLAEILADRVEWVDAIQETEIPDLWILPSGTAPSNPAELLTLDRFDEFLNLVREYYDLVIIDSPPLLAVSDAATIAPRVDGVVLTIRIKKNGGPAAVHAKDMLGAVDANIVGVVVNDVDENRTYRQAYYGKKYGYGYGYGYRRKYGYHSQYTYGDKRESNGKKKLEEVTS